MNLALALGVASIPLGLLLGYVLAIVVGGAAIILGGIALRRGTAAARTRAVAGLVAGFLGIALPLVLSC